MAYAKEFDEIRQELRQSVAGTIRFWPKVDGSGNVAASGTAGHCTFTVIDESAATVQSSTNATVTAVGSISRLDLSVSAIATLGEYIADVSWKASGGSATYRDRVPFSVVLYPFAATRVSLNDLVSLSDQADVICERIGVKRGIGSSTAADEMASVFGYEGRAMLDEKLRNVVASGAAVPVSGSIADWRASSWSFVRPRLILDTDRLLRVERLLACAAMFQADMSGVEGEQSERMYQHFLARGEDAFRALGQLRYDSGETGAATDVIESPGRTVIWRRA